MPYATALISFRYSPTRLRMMQLDFTLLFLWYAIPFGILGLRAALAGYRVWKKRTELRELEKKATPFTKEI